MPATAIAAALLSVVLVPGPAEATRPIIGHDYKDMCRNIEGKQPIYDVVGATARYEFAQKRNGTYFKYRCRLSDRVRMKR